MLKKARASPTREQNSYSSSYYFALWLHRHYHSDDVVTVIQSPVAVPASTFLGGKKNI